MASDAQRTIGALDGPKESDSTRIVAVSAIQDDYALLSISDEDHLPTKVARTSQSQSLSQRLAQHEHLPSQLHKEFSPKDRLVALSQAIADSESYNIVERQLVLATIEDMFEVEVGLEAKELCYLLLRAFTFLPEGSAVNSQLFELACKPVDLSLVHYQIEILNYLFKQVQQERIPAPKSSSCNTAAQSIIENLTSLFGHAEDARQAQRKIDWTHQVQSESAVTRRPEEEITLIKCLFVLRSIVTIQGHGVESSIIPHLVFKTTGLLKSTTGQAIMSGCIAIIKSCAPILMTLPTNISDCVRFLAFISNDESSRSRDLAGQTLFELLQCPTGFDIRRISMKIILGDPSLPLKLREAVFNMIADAIIHLQTSIDTKALSIEIKALCGSPQSEMTDRIEASFVAPLLNVAACCCERLQEQDLSNLLSVIQNTAKSIIHDEPAPEATDLRFAQGLINLFLLCYHKHGAPAVVIYNMLIQIITKVDSAIVKLAIMKFLVRLRCNAAYGMMVIKDPDTQTLAPALCRTKASAALAHTSSSPSSRKSNVSQTSPASKGSTRISMTPSRNRSRSKTRPQKVRDSFRTANHPLWMYEETRKGLPTDEFQETSGSLFAQAPQTIKTKRNLLDLELWLRIMVDILKTGNDWEIYSYVLVHLPSQLGNCSLFQGSVRQISELHDLLNEQLSENLFPDAPDHSGIRKGDIALCLYHALAMLVAYQDSVGIRQWKRVVSTFRYGIERWDRVGKFCIHALAICCHEIPNIISNHLGVIVEIMQKRITQVDLAVDILEFLGGLARIPDAFDRSDFALHQRIFGICIRYLQSSREHRTQHMISDRTQRNSNEYIFTIAYQVMIFWFLAISVRDRARHVAWITQELGWKSTRGKEEMDPQSLVFLDMMHRTAFSDLGETYAAPVFAHTIQKVYRRTWLIGLSIVTAELLISNDSAGTMARGQFTKRQASGTTHANYYHNTEERPSHQAVDTVGSADSSQDPFELYPNHMILQLISTISPSPTPLQPIPLPDDDEFTNRVIRVIDGTATVDGHKAAVIYIGYGQAQDRDILANQYGSEAFEAFVCGLGFKVGLRDATFNTQGLDRSTGTDGLYTYAWRDRVTEIVFHLPTLMPNESGSDPNYARKMSHIGNDHVKIIFNESGLPYNTDTFASDYNNVNIIITPEAHPCLPASATEIDKARIRASGEAEPSLTDEYGYYLVQALSSGQYPDISPAASSKVVSASGLPMFIRQLALNASVLCQVWARDGDEYTSSWLFRLQQILKLREKHASANASTNVGYPQAADAGPSPHIDGQSWTGTVSYGGLAEQDKLISSLDFTRWTR